MSHVKLLLVLMPDQPVQQVGVLFFAGCYLQNDVAQLCLSICQLHAVDRQEYQHGVRADALISVHKGMVLDQPKAETSCLLLQGRVNVRIVEALKRR